MPRRSQRPLRILVLEDETSRAPSTAALLRVLRARFEVVHVEPSADALLELTRQGTFDVAILPAEQAATLAGKSHLLAEVSHEMRTPLNALLGIADLLGDAVRGPEQKRQVVMLGRAGRHLLALADDLLDVSFAESGRMVLENRRLDLPRLVHDTAELLRTTARHKGLELRVDVAPDAPRRVNGDPRRLRQILFNLIGNAIKFTERGAIDVRLARDGERASRGSVVLSVSDSGIGVPPEKLEVIFGRFVQGDASIAGRHGGAGLGLHVVKRLVERMGGRVSVESTVGVGSTFRVSLTLESGHVARAPMPTSTEAVARPQRDLSGIRVLVVDDSDDSRELIASFLEGTGVALTFAETGAAALEALSSASFDLVLMDLRLPDLDGFDTTRELRRAERARGVPAVPVVALSADALPSAVMRSFAAGCSAHLAKPISRKTLQESILANRRAGDPSVPSPALQARFLATRAREVIVAREAVRRGDLEKLADIGHKLQGNGASFGFPGLSALGRSIESAAQAREIRQLRDLVTQLGSAVDEASGRAKGKPRPRSGTHARAVEPADRRRGGPS